MRLAFVTSDYPPDILGGAGISGSLLVENLVKRGIDTEVFVFNKKHPTSVILGARTHYYEHIKKLEMTTINISTLRHFRNTGFDIIHVYNVKQVPSIAILKKSVPAVATLNNLEIACLNVIKNLKTGCLKCSYVDSFTCAAEYLTGRYGKKYIFTTPIYWLQFILAKKLARRIERFFAVSENIKKVYVSSGIPEEKIKVVPNMVDPRFIMDEKEENGKLNILFSGRFEASKGAANLIEAYGTMPRRIREKTTLTLIGKGIEEGKYRAMIKKYGIEKTTEVKYVDYEDMPAVYKKASILVHPAIWPEPFSRTWLEALASGTAILSSRNPSSEETLKGCAMFFDAFNVDDLRDRLITLIENNDMRESLSMKGKRVIKRYLPENILPIIVEEYRRLLK